MKNITVTFAESGEITSYSNNNVLISSENNSITVTPTFPNTATLVLADYSKRVHIKTGNGGGDVKTFDDVLLLDSEYLSKGVLWIQFELYDDVGTSILFKELKLNIRACVDVTGGAYPDGYVVTITAGTITAISPTAEPHVLNAGTPKDAIFDFLIPTGATFTPYVDSSGNLSWTNNGLLTNPSTVNIKGPTGNTGAKGDNGYYFTPSIDSSGNVSWVNNGGLSNPTTVNVKGQKGDTGATGATGAKGDKGDMGDTGPTGATGAKGDTGQQGTQGIQGEKGDKGDTGTTDYNDLTNIPAFPPNIIINDTLFYCATIVDIDIDGNAILQQDGSGDYLMAVSITGQPFLKYIGQGV